MISSMPKASGFSPDSFSLSLSRATLALRQLAHVTQEVSCADTSTHFYREREQEGSTDGPHYLLSVSAGSELLSSSD
jgi:hypothetical protein